MARAIEPTITALAGILLKRQRNARNGQTVLEQFGDTESVEAVR
jgi:hypothetical protein